MNTEREKDRADKAEQLLADAKRQADDARKEYAALEQKYRKLKEQMNLLKQ